MPYNTYDHLCNGMKRKRSVLYATSWFKVSCSLLPLRCDGYKHRLILVLQVRASDPPERHEAQRISVTGFHWTFAVVVTVTGQITGGIKVLICG